MSLGLVEMASPELPECCIIPEDFYACLKTSNIFTFYTYLNCRIGILMRKNKV